MNKSVKSIGRNNYLNYLWNTGRGELPRWVSICVSVLIAVYCALKLPWIGKVLAHPNINDSGYSELMLNFQGGFVRRGLLGDILYFISSSTGVSPILLIQTICLMALTFVVIYFVRRFYKLNLNWWILASPIFLGFISFFIRKDFILYSLLIIAYMLIRDSQPSKVRIVVAILLLALGLFLHEAFIFWGVPVVMLSLIAERKSRKAGIVGLIILIAIFGLLSIFKGSEQVALEIVNSLHNLPDCETVKYDYWNSIGALTWKLKDTIELHSYLNFVNYYPVWLVIPIRLFVMLLIYYFLSNFIFSFKHDNHNTPESEKTSFSTLILFSFVCLIPMFTVLSCDWGRLYQYVALSTFGAYVTFSRVKLVGLFPKKVLAGVAKFNSSLERIVKPSPWLMVVLLFVLAVSPWCFTPFVALRQTIAGTLICKCLSLL